MKGIKCIIDKKYEVFLEEIPLKTYRKIASIARKIGKKDSTFYSKTEYFGKGPERVTNLTYYVRDGCPDFCGQINRKIPNNISIHFHDYFLNSLLDELKKISIEIEIGRNQFELKPVSIRRNTYERTIRNMLDNDFINMKDSQTGEEVF